LKKIPAAAATSLSIFPRCQTTSCSWLNLVERLFAGITRQRIRRGAFTSVQELKAAIEDWVAGWNADPTAFRVDRQARSHHRQTRTSEKGAGRGLRGM
jgi:hypothetical protein